METCWGYNIAGAKYFVGAFFNEKSFVHALTWKVLILEKGVLAVLEEALSSSRALSTVPLHQKAYLWYVEWIHLYNWC